MRKLSIDSFDIAVCSEHSGYASKAEYYCYVDTDCGKEFKVNLKLNDGESGGERRRKLSCVHPWRGDFYGSGLVEFIVEGVGKNAGRKLIKELIAEIDGAAN